VSTTVLISGGAGFIGTALAQRLVALGYEVAVMDVLHSQIHPHRARPASLPGSVPLLVGDVTVAADWDAALRVTQPDQVIHLAAETGTGQSLIEATRHGSVNVVGTAQLIDALTRTGLAPAQLVLASSRAVYGEGAWRTGDEVVYPGPRSHARLAAGLWDPEMPDGRFATPIASSAERTEPRPTNVYAATKLAQEHVLQAWAASRDTPLTILRLQNVYGPGQSLSNPYTGIVSLFALQAGSGRPLEVYEDGRILRDFVFIDDVVEALAAAVVAPATHRRVLDIGSGMATTIYDLAIRLASLCGAPTPTIVGKYRDGDVRAASCDISTAIKDLSWHPRWALDRGLPTLLEWVEAQVGDNGDGMSDGLGRGGPRVARQPVSARP